MSWAVVIPSARAMNLARSAWSVFARHPEMEAAQIVAVDDGARVWAESMLPSGVRWVAGPKPFVYARNVNLGVAACRDAEVAIIMGDDAELITPRGFDLAEEFVESHRAIGVLSAAVDGVIGNPRQKRADAGGFRIEADWLAFVCVAIPRRAWDRVGTLDERFVGYGCEDVDYCWRVRAAGLRLGVLDDWLVRHDGSIPSSFRTRADVAALSEANRSLLRAKWGHP